MKSLLTFHEEKMKKCLTIVIRERTSSFPDTPKSPCPAPSGEDKGLPRFGRFKSAERNPARCQARPALPGSRLPFSFLGACAAARGAPAASPAPPAVPGLAAGPAPGHGSV